MKVYTKANFFVMEFDGNLSNYYGNGTVNFSVKEGLIAFVHLPTNTILESDITSAELQDESGTPIGNLAACIDYLSTVINSISILSATITANDTDFATNTELANFNAKIQTQSLEASVPKSVKSTVSQNVDFNLQVARGLVAGWSLELKSGRNTDVDTASVPEDIWNGGGVYTGFPTGSPEELQVLSSSASDTGSLTFLYLASSTSTVWQSHTVTLNGTTPVNTGITAYRVHTARYAPAVNPFTTFNQGIITIRHRATTANVFIAIPIGTSQSYMAGYTVPAGSTGYLQKIKWIVSGATSAYCDVAMFIRNLGGSPRLRRNNTVSFGVPSVDIITGGLPLPAGTDIMPRVNTASANNLIVVCSYDIVVIQNP